MKIIKQIKQLEAFRKAQQEGDAHNVLENLLADGAHFLSAGLDAELPDLPGKTFKDLANALLIKDLETERAILLNELQMALVLEHATIPPYLTALYTLGTCQSWQAVEALRSVAVEEMLHLTLVANLMNALGGQPATDGADFIPNYPSPLPLNIDGISVSLIGFSQEAMAQGCAIERPRGFDLSHLFQTKIDYADMTIGEFYLRIEARLRYLVELYGDAVVFIGDRQRQVTQGFYYDGAGATFPIFDIHSAILALQTIRHQGEGANDTIWTGNRAQYKGFPEVAHFYRFNEVLKGQSYVYGDTIDSGPTGKKFVVEWDKAIRIKANSKLADYEDAPEILAAAKAFNQAYCDFLRTLNSAFNGSPELLQPGIGTMFNLKDLFLRLVNNPLPGQGNEGLHAAPTFEYVAAQGSQAEQSSSNPIQEKKMPMHNHLPSVPAPLSMPFYYASLNNCVVHYLVDPKNVEPYLKGTVLLPALFDGKACVAFNFQAYTGQFSGAVDQPPAEWGTSAYGITQEVELNIVAYPASQKDNLPQVSFEQWVMGEEQSKLMGNHRVWVPCDSPPAIQAGEELFGEPKFLTSFGVNIPSFNPVRNPNVAGYEAQWVQAWGFKVNDPTDAKLDIFTCILDVSDMQSVPGNISSITEYGMHDKQPIACRWNILQPLKTYFLPTPCSEKNSVSRVKLTYGQSTHPMKTDMEKLIGDSPAVAVQTFISDPAAIQSRAVFIK